MPQQKTPIQKLLEQAATSRHHAQQLAVEKQFESENRSQFSATLISFNASSGTWLCQLDDGSTIYAKSISAVGSKGKGDIVSLYKPSQGMAVIRYL